MRNKSGYSYFGASPDSCMGYDSESGNVSIENSELNAIAEILESSADEPESDIYFYAFSEVHSTKENHSDHTSTALSTGLGSSSWITDANGAVNQHLQYLPFGEDFIYQRSNSWNIPYTFSGKEKDRETGYSYPSTGSVQRFGASPDSCTGYDSELSVVSTDRSVSLGPLID